jgi:hypothetical protein
MTKNLGDYDRFARVLLSAVFAVLYFAGVTSGILGLTLVVLGGILLATSLMSWCPIYAVFGIKSCPVK